VHHASCILLFYGVLDVKFQASCVVALALCVLLFYSVLIRCCGCVKFHASCVVALASCIVHLFYGVVDVSSFTLVALLH
jgi:hypothetical protein